MALTPGQRIDLKKRVAETLGQQEWRDIDLTLAEFGLPIDDQWRGDDRIAYVLEMIGSSSADEVLAQLDDYLHPTAVGPAPPQPQSFDDPRNPWSGEGFRLFLSHVHAYAERAGALREELGRRSVDAFVAHDSIEPTEEWQEVIRYALGSCDGCLALLTPGFRESEWADQELGWCMARNVLVIPVEFGLTPYGFLGKYQAYPVKHGQSQADIALGVFELLVRKEESRHTVARALVTRWANTSSWDEARENYGFLRKVPKEAWTKELFDAVWEARDQVHDLRTASIDWKSSDAALDALFTDLPYQRPDKYDAEDDSDIPF